MEKILYELKPYLFFILGFMCGQLDHPAKWVSVGMFVAAGLTIRVWRRNARGSIL